MRITVTILVRYSAFWVKAALTGQHKMGNHKPSPANPEGVFFWKLDISDCQTSDYGSHILLE